MADSTTTKTTDNGTVNVEELVRSDEFMQGIMNDMASGEKGNKPEPEPEPEPKAEPEPTPEPEPEPTPEPEPKAEPEPVKAESLEKRFKDSQSFIGRQANEIGELRKMVEKMQASQQQAVQTEPYWEKLLKASPEEVEKITSQMSPAELLQFQARMIKDVINDKLKPVDQVLQQTAQDKEVAKQDRAWYDSHPDYEARRVAMQAIIKEAYPEGLNGANPYVVADMAYKFAEKLGATAQQKVDGENNKRILNARSVSGASKSVASTQGKQKPKDAKDAEIERVWGQVAPGITRT